MIYSDEYIFVEFEKSCIPWVKIFTKREYKELSDCDESTRERIFRAGIITERVMREFYNPDKINWASFANYVPRVHMHIQARFRDDAFFPESMWGQKQRDGRTVDLKLEEFSKALRQSLEKMG